MKDKIVLNSAEQRRVLVLNQLEAGVLSAAQAGQLLGLAERQLRRLRARYREEGASALDHGNRVLELALGGLVPGARDRLLPLPARAQKRQLPRGTEELDPGAAPDRLPASGHAHPAGLAELPLHRAAAPLQQLFPAGDEAGEQAEGGTRTRKTYDQPTTPLRRVLASGQADPTKIGELVSLYTDTSPLTLKRTIDRRLAALPAALEVNQSA